MKREHRVRGTVRLAMQAAAVVVVTSLGACAQLEPPVVQSDLPPPGAPSEAATVVVETVPAYRDTVADARSGGAVWQGTSKKPFMRVSACTVRLWKQKLPTSHLARTKAGRGQTLELSTPDDGIVAVLDLAPHRPGSEGSLYLGSTAPQTLADAVRQCL